MSAPAPVTPTSRRRTPEWVLPVTDLACALVAFTGGPAGVVALAILALLVLFGWRVSHVRDLRCEALLRLSTAQREGLELNDQTIRLLQNETSRYRRAFVYANGISAGKTPREAGLAAHRPDSTTTLADDPIETTHG